MNDPYTHDSTEKLYHVDYAGELEEEERGVVRDVCVLAGEEVDRPHVQESLPASAHAELQLRT